MFVHDLSPVIVSIGPLDIRYYSLAYIIGFMVYYYLLKRSKEKGLVQGLTDEKIDGLFLWILVGVIAGGRLFFWIFNQPSIFFTDPLEVLKVWHGGMSFHGGLIGTIVLGFLYCRNNNIKVMQVADVTVIAASIGLALGRIANFINGEIVGTPASVPWCVVFPSVDSLCRHPAQIYAFISHFLLFIVLLLFFVKNSRSMLHKGKRKYPSGLMFWIFIFLYGVLRVITDIWRDDPRFFLGISGGQLLSLLMAVIASRPLLDYLLMGKESYKSSYNKSDKGKKDEIS